MAQQSLGMGWQALGGVVAAGLTAYTMLPTVLPSYTRKYYQKIRTDDLQAEPVDERTLSLVDDVLTKVRMPTSKEKTIDIYFCRDIFPRYHGMMGQRTYCLLGLPWHYKWCSEQDFEKDKSEVIKKTFPWDHPAADAVKASLMLTDAEKKFVIARQMGYLDSNHVWVALGSRLATLFLGFTVGHFTSIKLGLLRGEVERGRAMTSRRPMILAGAIYTASMFAAVCLSVIITDSYNRLLDYYADNYAGTISREFSFAGYTYYNKVLNANIAQREILPDGEKMFTIFGNEARSSIRLKTLPLVSRRDYLKRLHEKQLESGDEEAPPTHSSQDSTSDFFSIDRYYRR